MMLANSVAQNFSNPQLNLLAAASARGWESEKQSFRVTRAFSSACVSLAGRIIYAPRLGVRERDAWVGCTAL
jgi:hypothetical protein